MKVLIIGGVAGGATAAARIRRLDEDAKIIIFERTGYVSYANCGLPYYIGGTIEDEDDLTLQSPKGFWDRYKVDVRVNQEVTRINTDKKTVSVTNLVNGDSYEESYDKLILSPGAKPVVPDIKGIDNDRVFTLRTVEDTFKIKAFIDNTNPETAVVIGGGYIGVEMAENLADRGIKVTVIEKDDHLLGVIDFDMACFVHAEMEKHGVKLMLNSNVSEIENSEGGLLIKTDCSQAVKADMVLLAVGVMPDSALAKDAGLNLGIRGSISVNDNMQTSNKDIYAVGDAIEVKHFVTGEKALIALAGPANKQGRIAADNICGIKSVYKGSQGSSVIKVFDMTVATTGINEAQAKAAGIDCEMAILSPMSHASYYPNSRVMTMKILFDKTNDKILGGQIVGYVGVDKRIDVLATAMRGGLKATELTELDLAYAPPYSSAKDPINMAGFIIENIVSGKVKQFYFEDVEKLPKDGSVFLLDARTPGEYARGHADGFVNIPIDSLRERLDEIPKGAAVYVMCQSGLRSYLSVRILSLNGFDCYNFAGGYRFYDVIRRGKAQSDKAYPCGLER
ncbi:MAG: CoA-disulfide reductase [Monoglobales bacterium]